MLRLCTVLSLKAGNPLSNKLDEELSLKHPVREKPCSRNRLAVPTRSWMQQL